MPMALNKVSIGQRRRHPFASASASCTDAGGPSNAIRQKTKGPHQTGPYPFVVVKHRVALCG
jgi:hypothetical protein